MEAHGSKPGSEVLAFEIVLPEPKVAEALWLAGHEKVIRLQRIRLADYLPMGVECSFLWARLFPDLLRRFDPRTSLYRTLAYLYGMQVAAVDEVVEAGLASPEQAQLLQISEAVQSSFSAALRTSTADRQSSTLNPSIERTATRLCIG